MDRDLANFYGVETKSLNQAVKRNMERFPAYYRFQLTKGETEEVVTKCDHLSVLKYSPYMAYAFTERGVAMLSAVLHSPKAVEVSIRIMDAFVAMRHFLLSNAQVFQRMAYAIADGHPVRSRQDGNSQTYWECIRKRGTR